VATLGNLAVGVVQFVNFRQNSKESGRQIDRLIDAANRIDDAADSFSRSSSSISGGVQDAVSKLSLQAQRVEDARVSSVQQSQKALDATIEQNHLDQRAWVGIGQPHFVVNEVDPYHFEIEARNVGKTPALGVSSRSGEFYSPSPMELKDIHYLNPPSINGTMFPTGNVILIWQSEGITNHSREITGFRGGDLKMFFYGEVTYKDVFGHRHFTHFCVSVDKNLVSSHPCPNNIYNDTDDASTPSRL
jgi:hypothetical protein